MIRSISTSPPDGMLVHRKVNPKQLNMPAFIHLGGEMHCECLAQEYNAMPTARARTTGNWDALCNSHSMSCLGFRVGEFRYSKYLVVKCREQLVKKAHE